jgi:hypothetical protein
MVEESYTKWNEGETKNVEFFKIDGEKLHELRRRYKINGFPNFVYLKAGTKGHDAKKYDGERNKDDMMKWFED